jgi:NIMA-interacting peptidyl-prolyl cis-trans isomerase 1
MSSSASSWEVRFSNSRQLPYFYNSSTQESTWQEPQGLSPEDIAKLPGAAQNLNRAANASSQKAAPAAPEGQVRASHLLVKHANSRRPSSWKEVSGHVVGC